MPVSEATYKKVALEDVHGKWEWICGDLRRKQPLTSPHFEQAFELAYLIRTQLDRTRYHVRCDQSRVVTKAGNYVIPDALVAPIEALGPDWRDSRDLEHFHGPLPFVAEVWSRSTGDYDQNEKLDAYKERGDEEIWLVHPYDRTVTAWRREADGSYSETLIREGSVAIRSLPGVTIELADLFA